MIDQTLVQLDNWYNEPTVGPERPKLLAKLALLELCGWLETEQDRIILALDKVTLCDPVWTNKEVVEKTFGFDYGKHFRPMCCRLYGEHFVRQIETAFEQQHPGDLERLKSYTGDLWVKRCNFAHEDVASNIKRQVTFSAPSWSINQLRMLKKILGRFELTVTKVL